MPLPTIGQTTFYSWDGRMSHPQLEIGIIKAMPGVPGDAILTGAMKTRLATIKCGLTLSGDQVSGETFAQSLRALAGFTTNVLDPMGVQWLNCKVISAEADVTLLAVTGSIRIDCVFLFQIPIANNPPY